MSRYNNVLQFHTSETKKVGLWDATEDTKLIEAVEMFRGKGRKNGISWGNVVKQLNNTRSQKQCKKRWDDAFADVYKRRVAKVSTHVDTTATATTTRSLLEEEKTPSSSASASDSASASTSLKTAAAECQERLQMQEDALIAGSLLNLSRMVK